MRRSKVVIVCGMVLAVLLIVFFILQANSLPIALKQAGLNTDAIAYIEELDSDHGYQFKVLKTTAETGELALAYVGKNWLGFWQIKNLNLSKSTQESDFVSIAWMKSARIRRFAFQDDPDFEQEWHFAYCGNDAIKEIEPLAEYLPHNVTVNVQQAGEWYIIHVITYADSEEIGMISMRTILEQNGFVETSAAS